MVHLGQFDGVLGVSINFELERKYCGVCAVLIPHSPDELDGNIVVCVVCMVLSAVVLSCVWYCRRIYEPSSGMDPPAAAAAAGGRICTIVSDIALFIC